MLAKIKLALRITVADFDSELTALAEAAQLDLQVAGVRTMANDGLVDRAIITYVRMNFGSPADYDRLKASYDEQKAQLVTATGYTYWGDDQC